MSEKLLSARAVGLRVGLSANTIHRMANKRKVKAYNPTGTNRRYFYESEVRAAIRSSVPTDLEAAHIAATRAVNRALALRASTSAAANPKSRRSEGSRRSP